jgi:MFS family permease
MPGELNAVAPGCHVTWADFDNIISSTTVFCCFLSFGGCIAGLGAALPQLAEQYDVEETDLGYVFIARGLGYMFGTVFSAGSIEISAVMKKHQVLVLALGVLCSGLSLGIMTVVTKIVGMYILIVIQGFGFGFVDTVGNIILPELWGNRVQVCSVISVFLEIILVQPWMQAGHAQFGIGATAL